MILCTATELKTAMPPPIELLDSLTAEYSTTKVNKLYTASTKIRRVMLRERKKMCHTNPLGSSLKGRGRIPLLEVKPMGG